MAIFYHYSPLEKERLYVVMDFMLFENGNLRVDLWESGMPYGMASFNLDERLEIGEIAVYNFKKLIGIMDSMIEAEIIEPPHCFVEYKSLKFPICKLRIDIPDPLYCPELKQEMKY